MVCPKCKGKVRVVDTCNDKENNEIYRRRECKVCDYEFMTIEFEIELDNKVKKIFRKYRRWYRNPRRKDETLSKSENE